ncbi:MAG: PAS-domain containing protein [Geminicoccaceae bacterium]
MKPRSFFLRQLLANKASRSHGFGIKTELLVALSVMAMLTAIASAVAWYAFNNIDGAVTRIIDHTIPEMGNALRLAEKSSEIAATAPGLMGSASQQEWLLERAKLEERAVELGALLAALEASSAVQKPIANLAETAEEIRVELRELSAAVGERLQLKARRDRALADLSAAHAEFLDTLEPPVDDAVFDLVISGEDLTADSTAALNELVASGVGVLQSLLTIHAEANLAAGLLGQAAHVSTPAMLEPVRERFVAAAATIDRTLRQLPDSVANEELRQASAALLRLGTGATSVFEVRDQEIRAADPEQGPLRARSEQMARAIRIAQENLLLALTPLVDDASYDLVMTSERITADSTEAITRFIDRGVNRLHMLLTIRAEGNLAAGLLNEAAGIADPSLLRPLEERFEAAVGPIEGTLRQLSEEGAVDRVRNATEALIAFGTAADGIFELRREELRQSAIAERALVASRVLAARLSDQVARLVATAQGASDAAAARSARAIAGGKLLLLFITAISVAGAALIGLCYVVPRIVRPLENITSAMTLLAAGDTSVDVPGRDRRDEIGRMAQALGVFRDTAIEVQESNLREIRDTRRRLSDAIESITEGFSLYDSDDRLVVCNSRYRTLLYPGSAEEISPGMTFESIIRHAAERGYIKDAEGRAAEWVEERLARHREAGEPHMQRRNDGRWILISERKTEDGGTVAVYSDVTELKQREEELAQKTIALEALSNKLAKYLSPQIYASIFAGRQEVKIATQRKKLTVFFSDIVDFTEISDKLESEDLTNLLNHYLTEMSQIALAHGATIDKYVGDAIVIFFGDPETKGVKRDAFACVKMAIVMRERMLELADVWRASGIERPLQCRIGINTGYCTVGNFGSEDRMDYTIVGGAVNLAARLESVAPPGEILLSYETYAHVQDQIHCIQRPSITVKGIAYPVATYQVVDFHKELSEDWRLSEEDLSRLKIDLDLQNMSEGERRRAATTLRRALDRLSAFGQDSQTERRDS